MSFLFRRRTVSGPPEFIIAGLGNPGKKYELTRHNAGFIFADLLADKLGVKIKKIQFKSTTADVEFGGRRCLLMKPQTFMNDSGEAIRLASAFYKIPPEKIIVVFDDVSLPCGRIRIRRNGSDGGHNGVKSVLYQLNSDAFPRIKLGIGEKPRPEYGLVDWVTSPFQKEELAALGQAAEKACAAAELMVRGETDRAMNAYNGRAT